MEEDVADIRQTPAASNPDADMDYTWEASDEGGSELADTLDTEPLDLVNEDLLRNDQARAIGFIGQTSEIQWLRSIILQLERTEDDTTGAHSQRRPSYTFSGSVDQASSFSFYTDGEDIDVNYLGDPYELPNPDMAGHLLGCYEATVHSSFPMLPKAALDGCRQYFISQSDQISRLTPRWQAIVNLVFALGAKYSHLTHATWQGDVHDHLLYHARARACGFDEMNLTSHPDVPQIQVGGLLALYYLSIGQISRASVTIGVAIRFAYALGLHVRNEDPSAPPTTKETLVRLWWSLYVLERQLSTITGRPSIIVDSACSVPLPLPIAYEQLSDNVGEMDRLRRVHSATPTTSPTNQVHPHGFTTAGVGRHPARAETKSDANRGSYFKAVVQIAIITQNIFTSLYSAGTMMRTAGESQQDISRLGQRLDQWASSLPSDFSFRDRVASSPQAHSRERMLLGFHFCSAKILLTRQCLGGLGQAADFSVPETFIRRMANMCVESAKAIADFLPDQPNTLPLHENGPWWCIIHHIMQAVSVILLALLHSTPSSQNQNTLSDCVKKLVRWLCAMQDPLAERAYQMALKAFQAVATRLSIDISDLWMDYAIAYAAPRAREHSLYSIGVPIASQPLQAPFVAASAPPLFTPNDDFFSNPAK